METQVFFYELEFKCKIMLQSFFLITNIQPGTWILTKIVTILQITISWNKEITGNTFSELVFSVNTVYTQLRENTSHNLCSYKSKSYNLKTLLTSKTN